MAKCSGECRSIAVASGIIRPVTSENGKLSFSKSVTRRCAEMWITPPCLYIWDLNFQRSIYTVARNSSKMAPFLECPLEVGPQLPQ